MFPLEASVMSFICLGPFLASDWVSHRCWHADRHVHRTPWSTWPNASAANNNGRGDYAAGQTSCKVSSRIPSRQHPNGPNWSNCAEQQLRMATHGTSPTLGCCRWPATANVAGSNGLPVAGGRSLVLFSAPWSFGQLSSCCSCRSQTCVAAIKPIL